MIDAEESDSFERNAYYKIKKIAHNKKYICESMTRELKN